ncbi:hypothetical protein [Streptomyces sp. NPDC051776]|uniref:hypothetical protein n=1 Tax=Streptomyces sp. NPDC051776 TaxID=3155414 RepID=UPI00343E4F83
MLVPTLVLLVSVPPKANDFRSFSGIVARQAEALPPDILVSLVREAIEARPRGSRTACAARA